MKILVTIILILFLPATVWADPVSSAVAAAVFFNTSASFATAVLIGNIVAGAVVIGGTFALNALGSIFSPKPKTPGFAIASQNRTFQAREPVTSRKVLVGEVKVSGPMTFITSTQNNKFHHYIVVFGDQEIQSINPVFLNANPIYPHQLDADGTVNSGKFKNKVRIKKYLGGPGQVADPDLVTEVTEWTSAHVGNGVAYLLIRFQFDNDTFPNGFPNASALCKGIKHFDPRTNLTEWTPNSLLVSRTYLTSKIFGIGEDAAEIDDTASISSANVCDEFVVTQQVIHQVTAVETSGDKLTLNGDILKFQTGDRVQFTTTGTLPAGLALATDYFVIVDQVKKGLEDTNPELVKMKAAVSYASALKEIAVDITSAGTGSHTVTKNAEPRYTCNGLIDTARDTGKMFSELLDSMGGVAVNVGGSWRLLPAAYQTPVNTYDEKDLIGDLSVDPKISIRERFNTVHGNYVSPLTNWQATDFPEVTNSTYVTADGGDKNRAKQDLPFTSRSGMAQRISKITLERHRQEIRLTAPYRIHMFREQPACTVKISDADFGFAQKEFEVVEMDFGFENDKNGVPVFTTAPKLRETASALFDWNSGEETKVDPAPNSTLPKFDSIAPPGIPAITEELYFTSGGQGVKSRMKISVTPPDDAFIQNYQFEHKLVSSSVWIVHSKTSSPTFSIDDVSPGVYNARVTAFNFKNVPSLPVSAQQEIFGKTADPVDITNFSMTVQNGQAQLEWDQHPDKDVQIGGFIKIRHSPLLTGATWAGSIALKKDAIAGSATNVVLPLLEGTYLARAVDSSDNVSVGTVSVSTTVPNIVKMNFVQTITEETLFNGVKTNVEVINNALQLATVAAVKIDSLTGLVDDAVGLVDNLGAQGVAQSGTYRFSNSIDLGAVFTARLTANINALAFVVSDLFDSADLFDSNELFDGPEADKAGIELFVRTTPDDPAGSPTWSGWQKFIVADYTARAFEFELRFASTNFDQNVKVSGLSVTVDLPDRVDGNNNILSLSTGVKSIVFGQSFKAVPSIGITGENLQQGDFWTITNKSITGFDVEFFNSASARVVRTFDWIAKGY